MGSNGWHVSRAKHHRGVADFLAGGGHEDWAAVALFYSAHQWVHSSLADEPSLPRDERHPRKHVSPSGQDGRGTNQLVQELYPQIAPAYISLFDMSRRTRYDHDTLSKSMGNDQVYKLLLVQHREVEEHCKALNKTRPRISTQQP